MRTRAMRSADGSHYVINGKKAWITSGPVADSMVVAPEKPSEATPSSCGGGRVIAITHSKP